MEMNYAFVLLNKRPFYCLCNIMFPYQIRLAGAPSTFLDQVSTLFTEFTAKPCFSHPKYSLKQIFIFQVVAINLFGLVVVGGDNAFHVLTVKQIEEQDNCSKQVRRDQQFWETD